MPINIKTKILFIHIPKCSGTYINNLLNLKNPILYSNNHSRDYANLGRTLQHYPLSHIIDITNSLKINIRDYYIFTIVRNPYTRFISAYMQYPTKCNKEFKEMINNRNLIDFVFFLKKKVEKEGYNFFKFGSYHQFQPMSDYINNSKQKIDIIKLDDGNYNRKIMEICKKSRNKYNNNKLNMGNGKNDVQYYLNNKTFLSCINYIYKEDFIKFNYNVI